MRDGLMSRCDERHVVRVGVDMCFCFIWFGRGEYTPCVMEYRFVLARLGSIISSFNYSD